MTSSTSPLSTVCPSTVTTGAAGAWADAPTPKKRPTDARSPPDCSGLPAPPFWGSSGVSGSGSSGVSGSAGVSSSGTVGAVQLSRTASSAAGATSCPSTWSCQLVTGVLSASSPSVSRPSSAAFSSLTAQGRLFTVTSPPDSARASAMVRGRLSS